MKLGFAGTPEFARTALKALVGTTHRVEVVLCQPDRPSGRGMQLKPGPVKETALSCGIEVLQPRSLRLDGRFPDEAKAAHQRLVELELDILVVAAYGLILPPSILDLPRLGCLNIHASLLPRWRGAAPIQRAIEAGDAETGICIMQMDEGLDTGAVLLERRVVIKPDATTASLTPELATVGAWALLEALYDIEEGSAVTVPQSESGLTYAKKIDKAEARLDWRQPAAVLERRIRAFDPAPGASVESGEGSFKVFKASVITGTLAPPGTVLFANASGIGIACACDVLVLHLLQRPGGRRVTAHEFLQAAALPVGSVLS
jgi:methionyl-tRNA formyltransferase